MKSTELNRINKISTSAKVISFVVVIVVLISAGRSIKSALSEQKIDVYTSFSSYYLQEKVVFGIYNNSPRPISLPSSNPWRIIDRQQKTVFAPVSTQSVITIQPGHIKEWNWNQVNNKGAQVASGQYEIIIGSRYRTKLVINKELGSKGYFTFRIDPHPETVRMFFDDPQTVRYAIDSFYSKVHRFPLGPIVDDRPSKSPYDSQYNWHVDKSKTRMVEVAMELCDGRPTDVQEDIDYWAYNVKTYCPWGAKVVKLE